ncbi:colanic acid/amylovoran biosynthesis glycosyltransferase [Flavobacteriaceae bacterium MAR_2010_72]|nr:colanic acid/amylovoran biosynthesis glycosyltransferase [Flavobacteriaceae bacterium MAR_2010_72]
MRIGIVLSKTPSYSETFFISKIKGLQAYGHEVVLFVQNKSHDFNICPVVRSPYSGKNGMLLAFQSLIIVFRILSHVQTVYRFVELERMANRSYRQILKNVYSNSHILIRKLDWLHFGFATMALQSEHVAKSIGAKMAVSLRGYDIAIYPLKHKNCYNRLWDSVDKVHTISDDLLTLALQQGLTRKVPYMKITPAINVNTFQAEGKIERGHTLQFITVARLHWKKGLVSTLEALARIKNDLPKFKYIIVGTGEIYQELAFAIHQLQLTGFVELVGQKQPEEVKILLCSSNIYIQYSLSEGFSNALLEAQACGLLCIASDAEGLTENVLDGVTGWIVKKNDPTLLAEKIIEVVNLSTRDKARFSKLARERVNAHFNLEQQQQAFNSFYN